MNIHQLQAKIKKHQEFHARKHDENKSGKDSINRLGRLMVLNGLIMDLTIRLNDMLLDEL